MTGRDREGFSRQREGRSATRSPLPGREGPGSQLLVITRPAPLTPSPTAPAPYSSSITIEFSFHRRKDMAQVHTCCC